MIQQAIQKAVEGQALTREEARGAMDELMGGTATQAQIGAFLTALRMKGETIDEITACAESMRSKAEKITLPGDCLDIVGTGGDCTNTFNISTASAFVVAGAGGKVAKHGNRSVSSKCGAADVLEALGAVITLPPAGSQAVFQETGMCFLFAPVYHKSMKYAAGPRRELGMRTIFNILGPLANPAGASLQLLGVYDDALVEPLAHVLANLGVKRAMAVHGQDGVDEISLCGETKVCEVRDGKSFSYLLNPDDFGFAPCALFDLTGGDAQENAGIIKDVLAGETGPKRDSVLLNSGAGFYLSSLASSLREGVTLAAKTIDSGAAMQKLSDFVEATQQAAEAAVSADRGLI